MGIESGERWLVAFDEDLLTNLREVTNERVLGIQLE